MSACDAAICSKEAQTITASAETLFNMYDKEEKSGVKIYWSDDDDAYVAEVPSLPGCIAHGSSYESAARNISEAMKLWLDSAQRHHDLISETGHWAF